MAYSQWHLPAESLNDAEMRYSAYERELLGIVWALAQWKHYCQGPHAVIVIQTDHAPLRHPPKSGERQFQNLEVDKYPARVQPGDPSYPR